MLKNIVNLPPSQYMQPTPATKKFGGLNVALATIFAVGIVVAHFTPLGKIGMIVFGTMSGSFLALTLATYAICTLKKINQLKLMAKNIDRQDPQDKWHTPLTEACIDGDFTLVKLYIALGADVNKASHFTKTTPLIEACRNGNYPLAAYLIDHGANVNQADVRNSTPLHNAAQDGSEKLIELLIKKGASKEAKDSDKRTPYDWAVALEKYLVTTLLFPSKS